MSTCVRVCVRGGPVCAARGMGFCVHVGKACVLVYVSPVWGLVEWFRSYGGGFVKGLCGGGVKGRLGGCDIFGCSGWSIGWRVIPFSVNAEKCFVHLYVFSEF